MQTPVGLGRTLTPSSYPRRLASGLALAGLVRCSPAPVGALPPCDDGAGFPKIPADAATVVVAAVGDAADCRSGGRQNDVADLLAGMRPDAMFALGDLAYPDGTIDEYLNCYGPSLGRFRSITRAVPGNHEYHTPHAGAYYAYFCGSSGSPFAGWYSFDIGRWHVVALNSNCGADLDVISSVADDFGGCGAESPQLAWLRADLAAHPGTCTLAMWHHPRWSSSTEGSSPSVEPIWQELVRHGVDVVLNGHAHDYQRFPPLDENGALDAARGARTFVVGTGGSPLSLFDAGVRVRSEVRDATSHGVLRLELKERSYAWSYVPISGDTFHDEGDAPCHI